MLVGVCADLHDNLANFKAFLKKTATLNLTELWLAGDCGTAETLKEICRIFDRPLVAVAGNVEIGHGPAKYAQLTAEVPHLKWGLPPLTHMIDKFSFGLFHFPIEAAAYVQTHQVDVVVSGHTHQPTLARFGQTWHINPGTLGGIFTPATYVLADFRLAAPPHFILKRLYE